MSTRPQIQEVEPDGRRRRGMRRRAELVEAVRRVVARDGVVGVSHRSVAAEAGLPHSAASHHFASIDDLLSAAMRSHTEELVAAMPHIPPDSDLRWFADELVGVFRADPHRILAGFELYLLATRRPALRPAVSLWLDLLTDLARHHTDDPDRVEACVGLLDGYFLQRLATATEPRADELERLLRAVLE